jgi:hypothetical protein
VRFLVAERIIYRSGDHGQSWAQEEFSTPDCIELGQGFVLSYTFDLLVVSPKDPTRVYLHGYCYIYDLDQHMHSVPMLITSKDAGITWEELGLGGDNAEQIVPSPVIAQRVYLLVGYRSWLQSDDGGSTGVVKDFPVDDLMLDALDSERLYGWVVGGIVPDTGRRSEDGGEYWIDWAEQPCILPPPDQFESNRILQLLAHPTQTRVLFVRCEETGLFRSDDGGDSWKHLASTPGQQLAINYGTSSLLWAGHDGLSASSDNGESWQLILPNDRVPTGIFLPNIEHNK